jgi:alkylation response protein AidB-like acyl-CoA dehydrogenase
VIGAIDNSLAEIEGDTAAGSMEIQKRIEEFAVECSILKVWCSEMLDRVVDQVLQLHGGYGYVEEYPAERSYRDSRINRIFEGTNEINRLIITGWMMKRAMQGRLALLPAIQRVMDEIMAGPQPREQQESELAAQYVLLANAKKLSLFCAGAASQKYGNELAEQQEIMAALADMISEVLVLESAILRTEKMRGRSPLALMMTKYYAARSFRILETAAETVLGAVAEGDALRTQMTIFRRFTKHDAENTVVLGRNIAVAMTEAGRYTI